MSLIYGVLDIVLRIFLNPYFSLPIVFFVGILLIFKKTVIISRWHHTFDDTHISAQDLYKSIEEDLIAKKLYGLDTRRITHQQSFLFGASREYLCISIKTYSFEVCTAYVGSCCYVSSWFFNKETLFRRVCLRIPIIRSFVNKKTMHQVDEEDAFCDIIHSSVIKSVDAMTGVKGSTLSEAERSIVALRNVMTYE